MTSLACLEVGASGCQTIVLGGAGADVAIRDGAVAPEGATLLMSSPGYVEGVRVVVASNLGWFDVDPLAALGLTGELALLRNDAEAAALGEWALRGGVADLAFVGLGTGVGGAVVRDGEVVESNLFGHVGGFSDLECTCGQFGCLETVAAGWALPRPLTDVAAVAEAVATAIRQTPIAAVDLVVLAGGVTAAHPQLIDALRAVMPERRVEGSAAPAGAKSASAWGLAHLYEVLQTAEAV